VTALAYPAGIESWTLQDLYYFPNLRTLDLTPGTDWLPEWTYNRSYVDKAGNATDTAKYSSKVGNIPWSNFASGYMSGSDIDIISDLLASGQLTSVKYTRNLYPKLDSVLNLHSGRVTWTPAAPLPEYGIPIPSKLLVDDYSVVDRNKGNIITPDATVPAAIAAKFTGANGLNGVYKVQIKATGDAKGGANTVAFALPAGFQFGFVPNGRLVFDCYIETSLDADYSWLKPAGISKYETWKSLRFFYSRKLSDDFPGDSPYVEADYPFGTSHRPGTFEAQPGKDQFFSFTDEELGAWKSFEVTAYNEDFESMATGHYRVIRIQFGSEDAGTPWPLPVFDVESAVPGVTVKQSETLTYYIANLRWSTK
jgi:hypothetical protein